MLRNSHSGGAGFCFTLLRSLIHPQSVNSLHTPFRSLWPRIACLLSLVLVSGSSLKAEVALAPIFADGMVLQRDQPLRIWGSAESGEQIVVRWEGIEVTTVGDAKRSWQVTLPALRASAIPGELRVSGRNTVRVRDVLVGDVWLCSGQSNMAFEVDRAFHAEEEILAARYPLIRHVLVPRRVKDEPSRDLEVEWQTCSPQTAGRFSAVGYYFARAQHLRNGVPIGLVNATWGGSPVQSWMSEEALLADPYAGPTMARWEKRLADYPRKNAEYLKAMADWRDAEQMARAQGERLETPMPRRPDGPGSQWQPNGLYNAMIHPLVPLTLKGVLWYQGEANAPEAEEYASLFTGMIRQWREDFGAELPFLFVQLANHRRSFDRTNLTWAYLREAQTTALALPRTGMAVSIDLGEVDDVHPRNKQDVGRRLAVIARALLDSSGEVHEGPTFRAVERDEQTLRVKFDHADGLTSGGREVLSFEVAGEDRQFHPATAVIDGGSVLVTSPEVAVPIAVRYAWHNFPEARLHNAAGLPAVPFRSHPW